LDEELSTVINLFGESPIPTCINNPLVKRELHSLFVANQEYYSKKHRRAALHYIKKK
jgi:hypothetical protein